MVRIDSHHHLWDPQRGDYPWMPRAGILHRPYLLDDLKAMRDETGVAGSIVVQAAPTLSETQFLMGLTRSDNRVLGVVGWLDINQTPQRFNLQLRSLLQNTETPLVGLRPMLQDMPDLGWLYDRDTQQNTREVASSDLTLDLLCVEAQLPTLADWLEHHPDLRVCVNHLGKPNYTRLSPTWVEAMARIAERPHSYCKISGIVTELPAQTAWEISQQHVEMALRLFGPERCAYGSDWPVCRLVTEAKEVSEFAQSLVSKLPPSKRDMLLGGAVSRLYPRSKPVSSA